MVSQGVGPAFFRIRERTVENRLAGHGNPDTGTAGRPDRHGRDPQVGRQGEQGVQFPLAHAHHGPGSGLPEQRRRYAGGLGLAR